MDPLTKSQQNLRGHQIGEMSVEQLRDWIDACEKMDEVSQLQQSTASVEAIA